MSKFETIESSNLEQFSSDFEQAAKLEKQGKITWYSDAPTSV